METLNIIQRHSGALFCLYWNTLWLKPHISSNIGILTMNFCQNMFQCMANISNIRLVQGDSVIMKRGENLDTTFAYWEIVQPPYISIEDCWCHQILPPVTRVYGQCIQVKRSVGRQITFWRSHPTPLCGFSDIQSYTLISPLFDVSTLISPEKGYTAHQTWHQCSRKCAKCIHYKCGIKNCSHYVVMNRENGYLTRSQRLNRRHSLKLGDGWSPICLDTKTPVKSDFTAQEYVKYIHCKK